MADLAQWMRLNDETDQSLAPKIGVSRVHVSRLRRKVHLPSPDLARKLEEITEIPAAEFIFDERAA